MNNSPNWTQQDYADYTARQTASGRIKNPAEAQPAKPQQAPRPALSPPAPIESGDSKRIRVRVTSRRMFLLDPDNVCEKFVIDLLRYSGVLPDDAPEFIELEIRQEKAASKSQQETIIEIIPP